MFIEWRTQKFIQRDSLLILQWRHNLDDFIVHSSIVKTTLMHLLDQLSYTANGYMKRFAAH